MSRIRSFRPIEFHQGCAIARVVLLREPTMTNFDWHEAVKDACVKQGYEPPQGDMLTRACAAVERALLQTMGPRPVKEPGAAPAVPKVDAPPLTPAEWSSFAATIKSVVVRSAVVRPTNVLTIARQTVDLSEHAALDQFYIDASVDGLAAVKRFAEIAILREPGWDFAAVRAAAPALGSLIKACFACGAHSRNLVAHHVIQIQHGGSNMPRNRVALCDACHAAVHPWLPPVPRADKSGWFGLSDIVAGAERLLGQSMGRKDGTR